MANVSNKKGTKYLQNIDNENNNNIQSDNEKLSNTPKNGDKNQIETPEFE